MKIELDSEYTRKEIINYIKKKNNNIESRVNKRIEVLDMLCFTGFFYTEQQLRSHIYNVYKNIELTLRLEGNHEDYKLIGDE